MKTNLLTLAVTLTVGVILAGSLLVPVISDATDDQVEFTNDGTYRMSPVGDKTVVFHTVNGAYTINDVSFTKANQPIIQNDTAMFYGTTGSYAGYEYLITSDGYNRYHVAGTTDFTMSFNGEDKTVTLTSVIGGTTYTNTYEYTNEVYYADPNGAYVWLGSLTGTVYVGDDWSRFNCWSDGDTDFYSVMGDVVKHNGALDDDATISKDLAPIEYIDGVSILESYSITINDTEINCRGFILPYKVVGTDVKKLGEYSELLNALPVLVIIGLVLAALGAIVVRNRD